MDKDLLLKRIREIPEVELHHRVIEPLLKHLGAEHVKNVHGPSERGKDFIFTKSEAFFGLSRLCVCQVKNAKLSNREAICTLEQLLEAKRTAVKNPMTKVHELPQEVFLITSYDLPELPSGHELLQRVRHECVIIEPSELLDAMVDKMPQACAELLEPGSGILQTILSFVQSHQEAGAFDLPETQKISAFFVNLGVAAHGSFLRQASTFVSSEQDENIPPYRETWLDRRSARSLAALASDLASKCGTDLPIRVVDRPVNKSESSDLERAVVDLTGLPNIIQTIARNTKRAESGDPSSWLSLLDTLDRLCENVIQEIGLRQWKSVSPSDLATIVEFAISEVAPEELLNCEGNVAIIGSAGAGKTCLARMLTEKAASQGIRAIYFPCSRITDEGPDLSGAIASFVESESEGLSPTEVSRFLANCQLIVLDGCDEAATSFENLGKAIRRLIAPREKIVAEFTGSGVDAVEFPSDLNKKFAIEAIRSGRMRIRLKEPISMVDLDRAIAVNQGNPCADALSRIKGQLENASIPKLILTSRRIEGLDVRSICNVVELQEFSDEQVDRFFRQWLSRSRYTHVSQFIASNKNVQEICRNPMTATIVASLAIRGFELPRSRTEVYKRRFELLLERWDRSRKVPERSSVAPTDKLRFLAEVAYRNHQNHTRHFQPADAREVWLTGFNLINLGVSIEQFVEELVTVDNAFFRESEGTLSLGHLSFQEYLTALSMVLGQKGNELATKYYDPWWQNVMVFFVGITGDASKLLRIVQNDNPISYSELTRRMLDEARYTPPTIKGVLEDLSNEIDELEEDEDLRAIDDETH